MSADGQFWLGLAFAIPLSIVANLFTPRIQDWLAKRSAAASVKRETAKAAEHARVAEYLAEPARFNSFLLTTLLVATMLGAGIGVFSALLYMLGNFAAGELGSVLAQGISVLGGLIITKICLDAANIAIRVREAQKAARAEGGT